MLVRELVLDLSSSVAIVQSPVPLFCSKALEVRLGECVFVVCGRCQFKTYSVNCKIHTRQSEILGELRITSGSSCPTDDNFEGILYI